MTSNKIDRYQDEEIKQTLADQRSIEIERNTKLGNPWAKLEKKAQDLFSARDLPEHEANFNRANNMSRLFSFYDHSLETARSNLPGSEGENNFSYGSNLSVIMRCFYPDSVEEIIRLLKEERCPFAQECLYRLELASPLALKLTLKLLREARKMGFVEAAISEMAVASHRILDKEFPTALEQRILPRQKNMDRSIWKYNSLEGISKEQVDSYFHIPEWATPKALGTVENAFLPNREFHRTFPESVRMWLNQEPLLNISLKEMFSRNLSAGLGVSKLDLKETGLTTKLLRSEFRNELSIGRYQLEAVSRARDLGKDPKLLEKYLQSRQELIDKLCGSDEVFYPEIHKRIEQSFEYFLKLKQTIVQTASNDSSKITKHRFILRLKQFLLENRVLTVMDKQLSEARSKFIGIGPKATYIPLLNDYSFFEKPHPYLRRYLTQYVVELLKKNKPVKLELVAFLVADNESSFREYLDKKTLDQGLKEKFLKLIDEALRNGTAKKGEVVPEKKLEPGMKGTIPSSMRECIENYLLSDRHHFPFYDSSSTNPYIVEMKNAVAWLLSKIASVELTEKGQSSLNLPQDIDEKDLLDLYLITRGSGKGLVGPIEYKLLPLYHMLVAPLVESEICSLETALCEVQSKANSLSQGAVEKAQAISEIKKLMAALKEECGAKAKKMEWNIQDGFGRKTENFINNKEFEKQLLALLLSGEIDSVLHGTMLDTYSKTVEYLGFLQYMLLNIQDYFYVNHELMMDFGESIHREGLKTLSSKSIKKIGSIFNVCWDRKYQTKAVPKVPHKTSKKEPSDAIIESLLKWNADAGFANFVLEALPFPGIINMEDLHSELKKSMERLRTDDLWRFINAKALIQLIAKDEDKALSVSMNSEAFDSLIKSIIAENKKDERIIRIIKAFSSLIQRHLKGWTWNERRSNSLSDILQSFEERYKAKGAAPEKVPEVSDQSGKDLIRNILRPSEEIKSMVNYYKNELEMLMLMEWDQKKAESLISEYTAARIIFVQLHPMFEELQKRGDLHARFSNEFETMMKEEISFAQKKVPFGYDLALKHLLPEPSTQFDKDEQRMSELRHFDFANHMQKVKKEFDDAQIKPSRRRVHQAAIADVMKNFFQPDASNLKYEDENEHEKNSVKGGSPEAQILYLQGLGKRSQLEDQKKAGELWDPSVDVPVVDQGDASEKRLRSYYVERREIIQAAKELQDYMVSRIDRRQDDPSKGFGRISGVNKLGESKPYLNDYDLIHLLELDSLTAQALYTPSYFRKSQQILPKVVIPDAYPKLDIRYDPKKWLEDSLSRIMMRIFGARFAVEKHLSEKQLRAFDYTILPHFERSKIKALLEQDLESDRNACIDGKRHAEQYEENVRNAKAKAVKLNLVEQPKAVMSLVKNKELLLRRFAYDAALWKNILRKNAVAVSDFEEKYGDLLTLETFKGSTFKF